MGHRYGFIGGLTGFTALEGYFDVVRSILELMFAASFDSKSGCLYFVFDVKKQGKPVWVVRTRNWKLRGGENRLSGFLEGVSMIHGYEWYSEGMRDDAMRLACMRNGAMRLACMRNGAMRLTCMRNDATRVSIPLCFHQVLVPREEYRYPSSPLGLEYRYWLPSTDTSCLKTVFGTP
ncbi:hypothetical protein GQ457_05G027910 [Hibiscus cannabinus]